MYRLEDSSVYVQKQGLKSFQNEIKELIKIIIWVSFPFRYSYVVEDSLSILYINNVIDIENDQKEVGSWSWQSY